MRRLLAALLLATTVLGCGGPATGTNKGPVGGEPPKEQKEADDLMRGNTKSK